MHESYDMHASLRIPQYDSSGRFESRQHPLITGCPLLAVHIVAVHASVTKLPITALLVLSEAEANRTPAMINA